MPSGRALTCLLLAATLVSGCTVVTSPEPSPSPTPDPIDTPGQPTGPVDGGTLRFALGANPVSIDPRFVEDDEGFVVVDALFDPLVAIGDDLVTVEPAAATSWEVSEDGLTYLFSLREGARYHDGSPVVADDFVRAFQRIVDRSESTLSSHYYLLADVEGYEEAVADHVPLSGIRALAPLELEIELTSPSVEFLHVLAHPGLAPTPESAAEDPDRWRSQPIGNGPFVMAEAWQPNQFIRLSRNADHHARPHLDEIVFQIYAEDRTRHQQFEDFVGGRVDVAEVPPDRLEEAAARFGTTEDGMSGPGVIDGVMGTAYYLGFNTELPPFDRTPVRRALSMLVDRDHIVTEILLGTRTPADGLVPSSLPGPGPSTCDVCTFDPAAARAELDLEEGQDADLGPIEIVHSTGATEERIADRVARDVELALGVTVTTRAVSPRTLLHEVRDGTVGIFRFGAQADHPSPGAILEPLFHSSSGSHNLTRFANDQVDVLLDEARTTEDPRARFDRYARAEAMILAEAPVAPVFFYRHARIVQATVDGLTISPVGRIDLSRVQKTRES